MEVGAVSFHNDKLVKKVFVAQRINEIVNRLNKSREEQYPNLEEERAAYDRQEKERRKALKQQEKKAEIEVGRALSVLYSDLCGIGMEFCVLSPVIRFSFFLQLHSQETSFISRAEN